MKTNLWEQNAPYDSLRTAWRSKLSKSILASALAVATIFGIQKEVHAQSPKMLLNKKVFDVPLGTFNNVPVPNPTEWNLSSFDTEYSQAMQCDPSGAALFYVKDGHVFSKSGKYIGDLFNSTVGRLKGTSGVTIVPHPTNCSQFYIVGATALITGSVGANMKPYFGVFDVSVYNSDTGEDGVLQNFPNGTLQSFESLGGDFQPGTNTVKNTGMIAVTPEINDKRFLFVRYGSRILRYKLDQNGLSYDNYFFDDVGDENFRSEMEIVYLPSVNRYRMATANATNLENYSLTIYDLDANGNVVLGNTKTVYLNSTVSGQKPIPHGMEFSKNGNYLYVSHKSVSGNSNELEFADLTQTTPALTPLNIPSVHMNDFGSSQLEVGIDGRLYMATDDRLAYLSDSNNPNSLFVNNYRMNSFHLSPGFSPVSGETPAYLLNDQIDGEDYTQHFLTDPSCCVEFQEYDIETFGETDYNSNVETWTGSNNPLNNSTGNIVEIRDYLIIPPGKTITIQGMTLKFAPQAKLIIEAGQDVQGGKLILDGTTLTVDDRCDVNSMWPGVEVWGYSNQGQGSFWSSTSSQGFLEMKKGSRIEHAILGVRLNKQGDFTQGGGVIRAVNSFFVDNQQDIEFRKYTYANKSYFKNCEFYNTSGSLKDPNREITYHVYMNDVQTISFYGCEFRNDSPNDFAFGDRGEGIVSIDAKLRVKELCSGLNCANVDRSKFENLQFGILSLSSNTLKNIDVTKGDFEGNVISIAMAGNHLSKINENNFKFNSAIPYTVGVHINGCDKYAVQENDFRPLASSSHGVGDNTVGIVVNNSGEGHNEIYRNYFQNLNVGIQPQGINGGLHNAVDPTNTGLQLRCNEFTANSYLADIGVTSGRIDYNQGYESNNNGNLAAGNQFSHSTFDPQNDIAANTGVQSFAYIHHWDNVTTPLSFNTDIVYPDLVGNSPIYMDANTCPSKILDPYSNNGNTISFLKSKIGTLKDDISSLESQIDNGATELLLLQVQNGNAQQAKNVVLDASPFVSDLVLEAYLNTSPSSVSLMQVISANAPVSDYIFNQVENYASIKESHLRKLRKEQQKKNNYSRLMLDHDIAALNYERTDALYRVLTYYEHTDTTDSADDSLYYYIKTEGLRLNSVMACDYHLSNKSMTLAQEAIDEMFTLYGAGNKYKALAEIERDLVPLPSSCQGIAQDPTLIARLRAIIDETQDASTKLRAEALLFLALSEEVGFPVEELFAVGSGYRNMVVNQEENSENFDFDIYPNPASSIVNISTEEGNLEKVRFEIFSVNGQLMGNFKPTGTLTKFDVSEFNAGIYYIRKIEVGEEIQIKKLVIKK